MFRDAAGRTPDLVFGVDPKMVEPGSHKWSTEQQQQFLGNLGADPDLVSTIIPEHMPLEFRHLVISMLQVDPLNRHTLKTYLTHPAFDGSKVPYQSNQWHCSTCGIRTWTIFYGVTHCRSCWKSNCHKCCKVTSEPYSYGVKICLKCIDPTNRHNGKESMLAKLNAWDLKYPPGR